MNLLLNENFITTKDAGELSGYNSDYLARLARSGKIIGKRIGHSWFVDRDSLMTFLSQQSDRKTEYARALARAREAEYLLHQDSRQRIVHQSTMTKIEKKVATYQFSISHFVPRIVRSEAFAVAVALLVVGGGALGAQAAFIPQVAERATDLAREVASGFAVAFGDASSHIASRIVNERNEVREISSRVAAANTLTTASIAPLALAEPDLSPLRMVLDDEQTNSRVVSESKHDDSTAALQKEIDIPVMSVEDLYLGAQTTLALLAEPALVASTLADAYITLGEKSYRSIALAFVDYRALIDASGVRALALGATARDALGTAPAFISRVNLALGTAVIDTTHALINADISLAYKTAEAAPESARIAVALIGGAGDHLARATERLTTHAPARVAQALFDAEYAIAKPFVAATSHLADRYLALIKDTGNVAYAVVAPVQSVQVRLTQSLFKSDLNTIGVVLQDVWLGTLGKVAAAWEGQTFPYAKGLIFPREMLAAVLAALSPVEQIALTTYDTLHGLVSSTTNTLAYLFGLGSQTSNPIPRSLTSNASRPLATATSSSPKQKIENRISNIGNTNPTPSAISYPTYVTTLNGVSVADVRTLLASERTSILATVSGMIQPVSNQVATNIQTIQMVNKIEDLTGLIVRNGNFIGGTFTGGTFSNGLAVSARTGDFESLTAGDASITGSLTVGSSTSIGAHVSAPYFVATSLTATSTFAGGLTVGGNRLVIDSTTGNLGIGTTSPVSTLSVVGESALAGGLSVGLGYAGTAAPIDGLIIQGNVGIGTTSPSAALAVSGNVMLGGTTGATLTGVGAGLTFTGTGNHDLVATGGTLRIGSNTIIGNIEALDSTVDIGTPATRFDKIYANEVNASTIVGTLTAGNLIAETFTINSDNASVDAENAYLAFHRGTVTPNALLTWNAAGSAKRFEFNQPIFMQDASASTTNTTLSIQSVAGQTGDILRVASSSSATNFFTITANGKVGIGAANPTYKLEVGDGSNAAIRLRNTGASGHTFSINSYSDGKLYFENNSAVTNPLILDNSSNATLLGNLTVQGTGNTTIAGNVGIGTTSPDTKLSVYSSGTSLVKVTNPTGGGYTGLWIEAKNTDASVNNWVIGPNQTADNAFQIGAYSGGTATPTGGSASFNITRTGNVGIGTTTPWAQLSINPNGNTGPAFAIGSSTATNFVVTNGGKVGIGTANPVYKLDVSDTTGGLPFISRSTQNATFYQDGLGINYSTNLSGANNSGLNLTSTGQQTSPAIFYSTSDGSRLVSQSVVSSNASVFKYNMGFYNPADFQIYRFENRAAVVNINYDGATTGMLNILTSWSGKVGMTITGVSGQTGDMLQVNSDGSIGGNLLVLKSSGNVGIGTTTPSNLLTVYSSSAAVAGFSGGATKGVWSMGYDVTNNRFAIASSSSITSNVRMVIDNQGNVGIGTTTPNNLLQVFDLIDFNNSNGNTKLGYQAGKNVVAGTVGNTLVGYQAGLSSASLSTSGASNNSAFGIRALWSNTTGHSNIAIGQESLYSNTDGFRNAATGFQSLHSNTTGYSNTANGQAALYSNTTGFYNSAVGDSALFSNVSGTYNVALGYLAGYNASPLLQTMTNSTFLGYNANSSVDGVTNSMALGNGAQVTKSNQVVIGNASVTETLLRGNVGIGTTTPTSKLSIQTASASGVGIFVQDFASQTASAFHYERSDNTSLLDIKRSATLGGQISLFASGGTGETKLTGNGGLSIDSGATGVVRLAPAGNDIYLQNMNTSGDILFTGNSGVDLTGKINFRNTGIINFGTAGSERMVITTAGNVGIGTTSPLARLSIQGSDTTANNYGLNVTSSTGASGLVVRNDGAVGIGTNNPNNVKLHIEQGTIYANSVQSDTVFSGNGTTVSTLNMMGSDGYWGIRTAINNSFNIDVVSPTSMTALTVLQSGNVGIGTTTPGSLLHLSAPSPAIQLTPSSYAGLYSVYLGSRDATGVLQLGNNGVNEIVAGNSGVGGSFRFVVNNTAAFPAVPNGTEAMRILVSGNVGIGTTTPQAPLHVQAAAVGSTGEAIAQFGVSDATSGFLTISNGSSANGEIFPVITGRGNLTGGSLLLYANGVSGQDTGTNPLMMFRSAINSGVVSTRPLFQWQQGDGTPEMTMDKNGNVGIGTTSPALGGDARVLTIEGAGQTQLELSRTGDVADDAGIGGVSFHMSKGGNGKLAQVLARASGTAEDAAHLTFWTKNSGGSITEKMRITDTGNVGIGTTSPDMLLSVGSATPVGSVAHFENSTGSCYINPTTTSLSCTSDIRLKSNFAAISTTTALAGIEALSPTFYNWNAEIAGAPQHAGFIAQQVLPIFPDLVSLNPDGFYAMNYAGLTPYLTAAVQALAAKIEPLAAVLTVEPGVNAQCVTGDTRLRRRRKRADGSFEFDEIAIADVVAGDEIQSLDEATGRVVYSRVNALMDMGEQEVYELVTRSGRRIRTTSNHPYLARIATTKV